MLQHGTRQLSQQSHLVSSSFINYEQSLTQRIWLQQLKHSTLYPLLMHKRDEQSGSARYWEALSPFVSWGVRSEQPLFTEL